jgi:hypothetical protein
MWGAARNEVELEVRDKSRVVGKQRQVEPHVLQSGTQSISLVG